jgi:hypothetical protein
MIRTKLVGLGTAAVLATGVSLLPAGMANAAPGSNASGSSITSTATQAVAPTAGSIPVTGTAADGTQVTGQITDLTTKVVDGVLVATGTINVPGAGTDTFTAPVQAVNSNGSCTVLTLDLGPLHLDLLGLVVDLAPVSLDVTAVPGSGNLLGNLLCAVTHLLDNTGGSGGALMGLSNLLNQILAGLGL